MSRRAPGTASTDRAPRRPSHPSHPSRPSRPWPDHWAVTTDYKLHGQWLRPGISVLVITGEPGGRFRFLRHVTNTATGTEWLDVVGGTGQGTPREVTMFRAFRPARVRRVLRPKVRP